MLKEAGIIAIRYDSKDQIIRWHFCVIVLELKHKYTHLAE
jgi:hypothetical protein